MDKESEHEVYTVTETQKCKTECQVGNNDSQKRCSLRGTMMVSFSYMFSNMYLLPVDQLWLGSSIFAVWADHLDAKKPYYVVRRV